MATHREGDGMGDAQPGVRLDLSGMSARLVLAAASMLLAVMAALEIAGRVPSIQTQFLAPSIGSADRHVEIQVAYLDAYSERHGAPNCYFLGSSTVLRGISPSAFEDAMRQGGIDGLHCYNLGIQGMNALYAPTVAQALIEYSHPRLILYGADTAHVDPPTGHGAAQKALDSPWFQYYLGDRSPESVAVAWLRSYRYLLMLNRFFQPHFTDWWHESEKFDFKLDEQGHVHSRPADRTNPIIFESRNDDSQGAASSRFTPLQSNIDAIVQLAALPGPQQVVVVSMPLHPSYFANQPNNIQAYDRAKEKLESVTQANGLLYIPEPPREMLYDDLWLNRLHLNAVGADVFGRYLGEHVSRAKAP
jgi:hypothetical protein